MTDHPTTLPPAPLEHCGHIPPQLFADQPPGLDDECVLRPAHSGSHTAANGMRWRLADSAPACSEECAEDHTYTGQCAQAPPVGATKPCRHCGNTIIYKPYFLDARGPNPPVWWHPPGSRTCSTIPNNWGPDEAWPIAEPEEAADVPVDVVTQQMAESASYPYPDGDITVLGPEIFASNDGVVICWKGENYVRQADPDPAASDDGLREQYAAAMREHYLVTNREEADADGNMPCRCGDWREAGPMGTDEEDWDSHLADAVLAVRDRRLEQLAVERDNAQERLTLCRTVLLTDGYFTADEIGPDIAPRIHELATHLRDRAETAEAKVARVRALHRPEGVVAAAEHGERADCPTCGYNTYPCPTARALYATTPAEPPGGRAEQAEAAIERVRRLLAEPRSLIDRGRLVAALNGPAPSTLPEEPRP